MYVFRIYEYSNLAHHCSITLVPHQIDINCTSHAHELMDHNFIPTYGVCFEYLFYARRIRFY